MSDDQACLEGALREPGLTFKSASPTGELGEGSV